jgi:CheY-like chemotaxis protein
LTIIRTVVSQFPETKIIAMSGGSARLPAADNLEISESFGADAVLSKPFSERELCLTVEQVLSAPSARA